MLGHDFQHDLIRKYTTLFGLLFNQINIERVNNEGTVTQKMKIPLSLANKDSMIVRMSQDPLINKEAAITLPRMAFEMVSLSYASDRHLNKGQQLRYLGDDPTYFQTIFQPVPFDFNFQLHVMVKFYEDGAKIVEQILPFFTPDYIISSLPIPELDIKRDIPVFLNSTTIQDVYETDFVNRRGIIWTLDFTLEGDLYGPIVNRKAITEIDLNIFNQNTNGQLGTITVRPGLDANGDPTTDANVSIPREEIWATDPYGVIKIVDIGPTPNTSANT